MARDGSVAVDHGVSLLLIEDVEAFLTDIGGGFARRQHDQLGDLVDPVGTMLTVLWCRPL